MKNKLLVLALVLCLILAACSSGKLVGKYLRTKELGGGLSATYCVLVYQNEDHSQYEVETSPKECE